MTNSTLICISFFVSFNLYQGGIADCDTLTQCTEMTPGSTQKERDATMIVGEGGKEAFACMTETGGLEMNLWSVADSKMNMASRSVLWKTLTCTLFGAFTITDLTTWNFRELDSDQLKCMNIARFMPSIMIDERGIAHSGEGLRDVICERLAMLHQNKTFHVSTLFKKIFKNMDPAVRSETFGPMRFVLDKPYRSGHGRNETDEVGNKYLAPWPKYGGSDNDIPKKLAHPGLRLMAAFGVFSGKDFNLSTANTNYEFWKAFFKSIT